MEDQVGPKKEEQVVVLVLARAHPLLDLHNIAHRKIIELKSKWQILP